MKILIIYANNNHRDLMKSLVLNLNKNQVYATACNLHYFIFDGQTRVGSVLINKTLLLLCKIPKVRGLLLKLKLYYLSIISMSFDIIDIQFFSSIYATFIRKLSLNKNVMVTYWGSDILNASKESISIQSQLIESLKLIRANSENVAEAVMKNFNLKKGQVIINRFGISKFDIIDGQSNCEKQLSFLSDQIKEDRIKICLGYNGGENQQHEILIKSISNLTLDIRSRIQLIVPFTYGYSNAYKVKILSLLQSTNVDFIFLQNFLTDKQAIDVVLATDVLVIVQKTDAFSATVQEHIFAENVVLAGSWLPYFGLRSQDVFIMDTGLEDLTSNLEIIIENYSDLKIKTKGNRVKMKNLSSWDSLIGEWIKTYHLAMSH